MRSLLILAASAVFATLSSAAAQSVTGDVTVNPYGTRVLIDPGTGERRVVPPLLMPGERLEPIRLHPPGHHPRTRAASHHVATTAAVPRPARTATTISSPPPVTPRGLADLTTQTSSPPPAPPPRKPPPRRTEVVETPPPHVTPPHVQPPRHTNIVETPPPQPTKPAVETRTASIETPKPVKPRGEGGKVRGVITFDANASDPSTTAVAAVRALAGDLNNALTDSATRVEIKAYAGARGQKSSDTRRLSLKRALVIRQLLIDDGVPAERIDVFALGGVDDDGPTDRVDVFLKS